MLTCPPLLIFLGILPFPEGSNLSNEYSKLKEFFLYTMALKVSFE